MNITCYDDTEESKTTFLNTQIKLRFIGFNSNAFMIDENSPHPPEDNGIHYSVIYVEVHKEPLSTDISINEYSLDTCQLKMNLNADKIVLRSIVKLFDQSLNQMEDDDLIETSTYAPNQLANDPLNPLRFLNIVEPPFHQDDEWRCWILCLMFAVKIVWLELGLMSDQTRTALSHVKSSKSSEMIENMKSTLNECANRYAANIDVVLSTDISSYLTFGFNDTEPDETDLLTRDRELKEKETSILKKSRYMQKRFPHLLTTCPLNQTGRIAMMTTRRPLTVVQITMTTPTTLTMRNRLKMGNQIHIIVMLYLTIYMTRME